MGAPSWPVQRAAAFGSAVLWCIGACSLSDPLNGYSSGGLGKAPDGGTPADKSVFDGGPSADGPRGADGATVVDAPPNEGTFCSHQQPPPFFCADFDEGDLTRVYELGMLSSVDAPEISSGCTGQVGGAARSGPGAFLAEFPAKSSSGTLFARYSQPRSAPAKGQTLQFDMQLLAYQAGQEIDFASLTMAGPNSGSHVRAYVVVQPSGQGQVALDNGSSYEYGSFGLVADGQWHTFRLELDLDPSLRARLFLDDIQSPVVDVPSTVSFTTSPSASFYLGPSVYPPSGTVRLAFDNAFVRLR